MQSSSDTMEMEPVPAEGASPASAGTTALQRAGNARADLGPASPRVHSGDATAGQAAAGSPERAWARLDPRGLTAALRSARSAVRSLPDRLGAQRSAALADATRSLLSSRTLIWVVGVATVLALGFGPSRSAYHAAGLTGGFGPVGNVLAAPAARWDAEWYLTIAHFGYMPELGPFTLARAAFFPLYPLLISIVSSIGLAGALAGVIVSMAALLAALYGLHRLMSLELAAWSRLREMIGPAAAGLQGREVARLAVVLTAFGPMAFFLSADYSEALYLALSIGVFLMARRGRWGWAGVLGGLAAATRSTGVLLLLPAAVLYLYGPRADRRADREPQRRPSRIGALAAQLTPRYRLRSEVSSLALIPLGVIAFMVWLWLAGGEPLAFVHAQAHWDRHFAGPFVAVWDGLKAAFEGARQLISGQSRHLYFPLEGKSPFIQAGHNLMLITFLALAVAPVIGVIRRLPAAYGAYIVAALALPLSYPVTTQPLMSLPRFLLVLFPLNMWLAAYLAPRPRARKALIAVSILALVFFTGQFSSWHWVS